jgi:flagellar hook-associated protein 3 FlgL
MASNSFTRTGTANAYDAALRQLTTRQNSLSALQENLTSGKRVVRASDDPTAAAQAERARTRIDRIATEQRALEIQKNSITQAEGALGDATEILQKFRDLVVQAGNGGNSPLERVTIAGQLTALRDELLTIANRKDGNGLPLFSGLGSLDQPFNSSSDGTPPDPDYSYDGLNGQQSATDVAIPFAMNGRTTWMDVPESNGLFHVSLGAANTGQAFSDIGVVTDPTTAAAAGNGYDYSISFDTTTTPATYTVTNTTTATPVLTAQPYTPGQAIKFNGLSLTVKGTPGNGDVLNLTANVPADRPSIFGVLDRAIAGMYNPGTLTGASSTSANFNHELAISLAQVDTSLERIGAARGQAGDLLNRADTITDTQSQRSIQSEGDRSRAEDLDMIKGISDFQNQQTSYSAALQSYASIQKLSLFNFLS